MLIWKRIMLNLIILYWKEIVDEEIVETREVDNAMNKTKISSPSRTLLKSLIMG